MLRTLFILFLFTSSLFADALATLKGPVTPVSTSPWPWFDYTEQGNRDELANTALAFKPQLGAAAAGTFDLHHGSCELTLTGAGASEFSPGDWAIVAWDATDGAGTGRFLFTVASVTGGTVLHDTHCSYPPNMSDQTGLTVYHAGPGAPLDDGSPKTRGFGWWLPYSNNNPWYFYDTGLGLYTHADRSGDAGELAQARDFVDTAWQWSLNQGGLYFDPPRSASLTSQFIRALDGKSERFAPIYTMIMSYLTAYFPLSYVSYPRWDSREDGYVIMFLAEGAIADPDATRHASYCSTLHDYVSAALTLQQPEGYWADKSLQYAYRLPGTSPWRQFAVFRALAFSYDAFNDTSSAGCNDTALASTILTAAENLQAFMYNYAYDPVNRGTYYDVQYPNDGQNTPAGPGTVSATLTSSVVVGDAFTTFLTTFAPGKFIGIQDPTSGNTWTYEVASIADDHTMTLTSNYSDGGGGLAGPSANAVNYNYVESDPSNTNCNGVASHCHTDTGTGNNPDGSLKGSREYSVETIWGYGWLYKTTGNAIWKTRGDEVFSATYGGPANGPGYNYPGSAGACGGPGCDGYEGEFVFTLKACAVSPTVPCDAPNNLSPPLCYNGATCVLGKWYGQRAGIGGADNYLAWRLQSPACSDAAFSPTSVSVDAGSHTGTFDFTVTDQTCNRDISASGAGSCTANCTGTGNQLGIAWSMPANTGSARSSTLSGAGITFTINQAGGSTSSNQKVTGARMQGVRLQ